jgi:hypothetical protein
MFQATDIVIAAFIKRLQEEYQVAYGAGEPGHTDIIADMARTALGRIALSNALFHTLDYAMTVTEVGLDILKGRMIRDGDVTPRAWLHFVTSALMTSVGFVRDACPGDSPGRCVIDKRGKYVTLPRGATDGYLWPHSIPRAKLFVRYRLRGHPVLEPDEIAANIDYCRFPPPRDRNQETGTWPGLLRASQFIGTVADPNFLRKLKPLFLELKESGVAGDLGFKHAADLRAGYGALFWTHIHDMTREGVDLLRYTNSGRQWLANMYAQLLSEERETPALGMVRRKKA